MRLAALIVMVVGVVVVAFFAGVAIGSSSLAAGTSGCKTPPSPARLLAEVAP